MIQQNFAIQGGQNPSQVQEDKHMLIHSMSKLLEQNTLLNKTIVSSLAIRIIESIWQQQLILLMAIVNSNKSEFNFLKQGMSIETKNIRKKYSIVSLKKIFLNYFKTWRIQIQVKYNAVIKKELRKVSARFLCELLHDSNQNQERFCQFLNINMISGGICINQIPSAFISILAQNPSIMEKIQRKSQAIQDNLKELCNGELPLCWYVTLQQLYTQDVEPQFFYKKQNQDIEDIINDFLDPETTIFGIYVSNSLCPPPSSSRNSVCTNHLIDENISNQICLLPQSHSTKKMSNLNRSIEMNSYKRTETHEKSPIKYSSPHNFRKQQDGNSILQVRNSLQTKDLQGIGMYDQKRNSIDDFGLQNEYISVSQSLNFKGENNFNSYNNFRQSLSPNHTNLNANNSQLSQLYSQTHNQNKISKKTNSDRNTPVHDYSYIPHQEINLLEGNDSIYSNRNKLPLDLSSSQQTANQLIMQQNRQLSQLNQQYLQSSCQGDLQNSYREPQIQSPIHTNQFQKSINHRISQMNSESDQPESLFQSVLNQQDLISHQTSVNNFQIPAKTTSQSNTANKETSESLSRGSSPVFKYSSNKVNKYFLSPDQRNLNTKTVNYNLTSKENNYNNNNNNNEQKMQNNNGLTQNNINKNSISNSVNSTYININSNNNINKNLPNNNVNSRLSNDNRVLTGNINGTNSFYSQNLSTVINKFNSYQNNQQTDANQQKLIDPQSFLVSSQNGIISNNNLNEQGSNYNHHHTHSKSKNPESQSRISQSKQASLISYKQLSNNASINDSAYLKTFTAYNNSIQGSFVKDPSSLNEVIQKIDTLNIDRNDYQIQQEVEVKQQIPNLNQFRTSLDSQINIYSSQSSHNNNEHRLSLQKSPTHMKARRTSNGQTSMQLELTDLEYNQSKNTSKLMDNKILQQKNEIISGNDTSSLQLKQNISSMSSSTRAIANSSSFQLNLHRGTGIDQSAKLQSSQYKNLMMNQNSNNIQRDINQNHQQKTTSNHNSKGSTINYQDKKKIQTNGLMSSQDHLSLKKITQCITSTSPKLNLIISPRNTASSVKENQVQNESKQQQQNTQSNAGQGTGSSQNLSNVYTSNQKQSTSGSNSGNNPEILQSRKSHDLWMMNYIIQTSKRKNSYDVSKTNQPVNNLVFQSRNMQNQNNNDKSQNKASLNNKLDQKNELQSNNNLTHTQKAEHSKKNTLLSQGNEKQLQINTQIRAVSPQSNLLSSQTSKYHKSFAKDDFKSPQQSIRKKMIM